MPGGEGSPINLLDRQHHHRASATAATATAVSAVSSATRVSATATVATAAADECANDDDVGATTVASTTGATLGSGNTMTSALAGDGLRRRKVIHAAKETLDKGECSRGWPCLRSLVCIRYAIAYPRSLSSIVTRRRATSPSRSPAYPLGSGKSWYQPRVREYPLSIGLSVQGSALTNERVRAARSIPLARHDNQPLVFSRSSSNSLRHCASARRRNRRITGD